MKTTTSAIFFASGILSTVLAAPSLASTYTLKIDSSNPRLNGSTVVVKDESSGAAFPNPLGSFSTGEPRHAYTFTPSLISAADKMYELKSTVKQTHLIVNGDPIAPQFFESPVNGDPAPIADKTVTRTRFIIWDDMTLWGAENEKSGVGSYQNSAGTWRACNSTTVDYQLYFYDGRSNLTAFLGNCESVKLNLTEVSPVASTTVVPMTTRAWITGVGAPSTLITSAIITGVPAPSSNCVTGATATITGVPAPSNIPQITIRISNDRTGAGASASIPADGTSHYISDLFRGTALDTNGDIIGTSAQLVKFLDSTKCVLKNINIQDWNIELDGRANNFANLDHDTSKAVPVWLNGFTFSCAA